MHSISFTIAVRIKRCLNPKIMTDPQIGIFKCFHHLSFTIFKNWNGRLRSKARPRTDDTMNGEVRHRDGEGRETKTKHDGYLPKGI